MGVVIDTVTDVTVIGSSAYIVTSYVAGNQYPFTVAFISDSVGSTGGISFNEGKLLIVRLIQAGLLGLNSDGTIYSLDDRLSINGDGQILFTF